MLAQLRLAWWREQFATSIESAPRGEPLLALLREWEPERRSLAGLVDGWEAFSASVDAGQGIAQLAEARGDAMGAIAQMVGAARVEADARRMGVGWALADLASRLATPDERHAARMQVGAHDWRARTLPRGMRPLAVLHGLATRAARQRSVIDALGPAAMATAMRIGLLGR